MGGFDKVLPSCKVSSHSKKFLRSSRRVQTTGVFYGSNLLDCIKTVCFSYVTQVCFLWTNRKGRRCGPRLAVDDNFVAL